ncbi:MAG TPA: PPC domain-containing protein [Gemmataceae bacterium]|jgi:hypothetical protein|nr:PPC domain-containing protein [Gemmataceae bacterium]
MNRLHLTPLALALWALSAGALHAQLPHIRLDRIFPLGGEAGTQVQVEIAGHDTEDVKSLHFDDPGLKAVWIKPNQFLVTIAPETRRGSHDVRAVGKYGISGARLFCVSRGLTEVKEQEPNDTPEQAQLVPVNCAINGNSDNNGDDFYRFRLQKGERVTIDCQAFRLDSTLRGSMVLSAADGKELAHSKPYYDRTDPFLDFVAPFGGEFVLRLHDATFAGGLPYRLVISNQPQIENAFPTAVTPGEKTELTLLGRNLPGGKPAPEWVVQGQRLDRLVVPFTAPGAALHSQGFDAVGALTSASLNIRGVQCWPPLPDNALSPLTLAFADAPVTCEREPNDTAATAQEIVLPTVVCGRFDKPGDADWYTFAAQAGQSIRINLLCERLGMPGDPFVLVTDARGNEVASFDDHGINIDSLAQNNRDPLGVFTAPAAGKYRLLVQDRYRHGGARFVYALSIGKPEPDFFPVAFHETPVAPSCPLVRQGGSAFCELCLNRRDFHGFVTIEAEGLPPGVRCPPVHVSPQTELASIVFTAARDAPEWSGAIRLKAWALVAGKRLEREVRWSQRRWNIDNINTSRVCREICLAVRPGAPYALKMPVGGISVAAGAAGETRVVAERLAIDFKGKIQLNGLNLPPGFEVPATELPADKNEIKVKIKVARNVPPGTYSIVLRGDAQTPFTKEPAASNKPNVRVADPSEPLTVVVTAAGRK